MYRIYRVHSSTAYNKESLEFQLKIETLKPLISNNINLIPKFAKVVGLSVKFFESIKQLHL